MSGAESVVSIYLSSTWEDLRAERAALLEAMRRLDGVRCVGMEDFGSRSLTPAEASVSLVDQCQYYVAVIGGRYGSGITEQEYHRAVEMGLECFIYFYSGARSDGPPGVDDRAKLDAFRAVLGRNHLVSEVGSVGTLAAKMVADLSNHMRAGRRGFLPDQVSHLPCLVDRDAQAYRIESLTKALFKEPRPRPIAFVVPGHRSGFHMGLVRRYQYYQLPALFRECRGHIPPLDAFTLLPWPDLEGQGDARDRLSIMRGELNRALSLHSEAAVDDTYAALRDLGKTKVFVSCISVPRWRADEPELIDGWLDFWRGARCAGDAYPVVFLCVQFDGSPGWRFLGGLVKSPAKMAEQWLKTMQKEAADVHVVSELKRIGADQASDWARVRCARERSDLDVDLLGDEVKRLYEGKEDFAMEDLVQPLRSALEKAWNPRRRAAT
jgi:hypothetical protein